MWFTAPFSELVCTSRSWLWMGTRQFQDMTSRHPCYQLGLWSSAAFDITVASPLNSINMLEAGMYQGVSAKAAEHRKHTENDPKCVELGWRCIPLAVESYGAWGPEALRAFSQVATRLAIRGNTPKSKVSLLLVRANA